MNYFLSLQRPKYQKIPNIANTGGILLRPCLWMTQHTGNSFMRDTTAELAIIYIYTHVGSEYSPIAGTSLALKDREQKAEIWTKWPTLPTGLVAKAVEALVLCAIYMALEIFLNGGSSCTWASFFATRCFTIVLHEWRIYSANLLLSTDCTHPVANHTIPGSRVRSGETSCQDCPWSWLYITGRSGIIVLVFTECSLILEINHSNWFHPSTDWIFINLHKFTYMYMFSPWGVKP